MHLLRLHVFTGGAGVANVRISQRDDLTAIRWVGQNLLITAHRRIENDFANGLTFCTNRLAVKNGAVL